MISKTIMMRMNMRMNMMMMMMMMITIMIMIMVMRIISHLFSYFCRVLLEMIFQQRLNSFVWSFWQSIGGEASCIGGHHGLLGEKTSQLSQKRGVHHTLVRIVGKNMKTQMGGFHPQYESLYVIAKLLFNLVLSWTALKCVYEEWWIDSPK